MNSNVPAQGEHRMGGGRKRRRDREGWKEEEKSKYLTKAVAAKVLTAMNSKIPAIS